MGIYFTLGTGFLFGIVCLVVGVLIIRNMPKEIISLICGSGLICIGLIVLSAVCVTGNRTISDDAYGVTNQVIFRPQ